MHSENAAVKNAWTMVAEILKALERIAAEDARRNEAAKASRALRGETEQAGLTK